MLLAGMVASAILGTFALAQEESIACPCFSLEEVSAVFANGMSRGDGEGSLNCHTKDYSVEFTGEVSVIDPDYRTVARASVKWADFDPGSCSYHDGSVDPAVDRNERWPHPAPEAPVRACLAILSQVITDSDDSGKCSTYP